jgi:excisionase family DNA binding protein
VFRQKIKHRMKTMDKDMMTTEEAAAYLGLKRTTLDADRSVRKGCLGLPFYRVGKKIQYSKADIDQWLESRREVPEPTE